jgi:hypothetical protein
MLEQPTKAILFYDEFLFKIRSSTCFGQQLVHLQGDVYVDGTG